VIYTPDVLKRLKKPWQILRDFRIQRRPNQRGGKQPLEIQQRQGRSKISSAPQTLILPTANNVPGHLRYTSTGSFCSSWIKTPSVKQWIECCLQRVRTFKSSATVATTPPSRPAPVFKPIAGKRKGPIVFWSSATPPSEMLGRAATVKNARQHKMVCSSGLNESFSDVCSSLKCLGLH
jgi:hypothetical protein